MKKNLLFSALIAGTLCILPSAFAQTFQPGEIVTTKDINETIEVKVIKQDGSGVLCLIKDWQDHTFKPGGSSRYYDASALTRPGPPANPAAGGGTAGGFGAGAGYGGGGGGAAYGGGGAAQGGGAAADLGGTGPLSKQQIIDYLKARVGTDGPHPKKEATSKAVVEAIKKRGVNFKYGWQDMSAFLGAGADTTVGYAISDNYGAPVQMPWLFGPWDLSFTSATGFFASRDSGAKMGFVSIEPGHTYIWKIHSDDPASKWIDGKWREATPEEMKYQGGAGLVLLDGEQGWDWIVHKDMTATGGDWINVADISTRQVKRGGLRKR